MKPLFACVLAVFCTTALANGKIQIVRDGIAVDAESGKTFATNVLRLIESCSVDTTQWAVHDGVWPELLNSRNFLRVTLEPQLRKISTEGAGEFEADEILLRLGVETKPDHIFMKSGDQVRSCAKYSPKALLTLAREPVLKLAAERYFADLAKAMP